MWLLSWLGASASALDPSSGLSRCALSVPFLLPFSVRSISLCGVCAVSYEPVVANLCVVCGHYSRSAGWTTASAAGRSASSQPVTTDKVTHGTCVPGSVTDKFLISLVMFIVVYDTVVVADDAACLPTTAAPASERTAFIDKGIASAGTEAGDRQSHR